MGFLGPQVLATLGDPHCTSVVDVNTSRGTGRCAVLDPTRGIGSLQKALWSTQGSCAVKGPLFSGVA